jgi:hypothetical protein
VRIGQQIREADGAGGIRSRLVGLANDGVHAGSAVIRDDNAQSTDVVRACEIPEIDDDGRLQAVSLDGAEKLVSAIQVGC